MLLENVDYFVRLVKFPRGAVDGCVTPNDDGTFSIYIDETAPREKQLKALDHELNHIRLDHFYEDNPPERMEREADTGVKENTIIEKPDWITSWQRCMAQCREEMIKAGITPMW